MAIKRLDRRKIRIMPEGSGEYLRTLEASSAGHSGTQSTPSLRSVVLGLISTTIAVAIVIGKLKQAMLGLATVLATAGTLVRMLKTIASAISRRKG